jgi:hypothetical protein
MPKHTNPQRDMLEHPIFALPDKRIHHIWTMPLPRWVEPESGDEIGVR